MNRGAEWNRWDLHVHTKDTNKNDQFTSETFDDFCIDFFKKAVEKNIKVIGITDYFSIENYLKVKDFLTRLNEMDELSEIKEEVEKIYLMPNIELRMLPSTGSGKLINIHCLFNPDYVDNLEDDFFSTLEFNTFKMTKNGITRLGKYMNHDLENDDIAYSHGINNFVITPDQLESIFNKNSELRRNTITVVSNSSIDGASGLQKHYELFENDNESSLAGIRKKIYYLSNMIFSGRKGDIDYFLGKKSDSGEQVIQKCGSIKPCIHGSDAHTEEKLFSPDLDRYCWIKGTTNFEGLKQLIYEPSRVKIQEEKPEKKIGYEVIKSIKIFNTDNIFTEKEICFNSNLNAIIGGKSSGKSLLLYLVAKTVLSTEKFREISKYKNFVNYDDLPSNIDCEVLWEDETISKLSTNENKRHIEYIPQLFLNNIAEDKKNELFNQTIYDLLYKKDGYKEGLDLIYRRIAEKKISLTSEIEKYFNNDSELKRVELELTMLGDKGAIETLISNFKDALAELKSKSSLTKDDEKTMNDINKSIDTKKKSKLMIESEISLNSSIDNVNNEISSKIKQFIIDEFNLIDTIPLKAVVDISGVYTIGVELMYKIPETGNEFLFDTEQGIMTDLEANDGYTTWIDKSSTNARFELQFSTEPLNMKAEYSDGAVSVYPNPINESTRINFNNESANQVNFSVYSITGQLVDQLNDVNPDFSYSGSNISSGIYTYELQSANRLIAKGKLVVND